MSRSSWLTMPRTLMHEIPDEWQKKMAALLEQWDSAWNTNQMPSPHVTARENGKLTKWPHWLLNYRRPDYAEIQKLKQEAADANNY